MVDNACPRRRSFWPCVPCLAFVIVGSLLSFVATAHAQGQLLGAIHGTVKDEQGGVLPGVYITATPRDKRPPIVVATDAAGFYSLRDLEPGEYDVRAELTGFATLIQPAVRARAGLTVSLDLVLGIGSVGEVVTVKRDAPLLEVSSAATAVNISGDFQRAVPLSSRRNWSDFLLLTPGVLSTETDFTGSTFAFFANGSAFSQHVLQVDGADLGKASSSDPRLIGLSTEAIADAQITTAGADASSPLGQGAIISLVTKSGTNQLRGFASALFQPRSWNASNSPSGISPSVSSTQPDVALGGPLIRDRAWLFGSYRRAASNASIYRTEDELATLRTLDPGFEAQDARNRGHYYFVKLTANIHQNHSLSGFFQYDKAHADISSSTDANIYPQSSGGTGALVRLSSVWSPVLTSQVSISYNNKTTEFPLATNDVPSQAVYRSITSAAGRPTGVGFLATLGSPIPYWSELPQHKSTVAADVTFSPRVPILGTHVIRTGVYLQPAMSYESTLHYVNDGFAQEDLVLSDPALATARLVPFRRRYYDGNNTSQRGRVSDAAIYIQDGWSPHSRLNITAGVRVDRITSRDTLFDVRTQASVEIGPRVGLLLALPGRTSHSIRATWGRVHSHVRPILASGTATVGYQDAYDTNLDGVFDTTFVTPGVTRVSSSVIFDKALHQPFVDEATLGYRRQLGFGIVIDTGYVFRRFRDRRTTVETNGIIEESVFRGYKDASQNAIYLIANNRWNTPVVSSVDLSVTKQTSVLQVLASYSRQWRYMTGSWQPNDPAAILQPNAFRNTRGLGVVASEGIASPTYNASSLAPFNMALFDGGSPWRDHAFKLGAAWHLSARLLTSVSYTYQSGPWSGPILVRTATPDPAHGPATLVLPTGRVVSNPLADTLRFIGETRSDGQFTLPGYHSLNLSGGYTLPLGQRRVTLSVEGFNLTNEAADQGLTISGNISSDPNFRVLTNRQRPRTAQLAIRVEF